MIKKNDPSNRTIGSDGLLFLKDGAITELVGDGTKSLDELVKGTGGTGGAGDKAGDGFYKITAVDTTASAFTGLGIGDYLYNDGKLVLKTGDKAVPILLTQTDEPDTSIKGFEISFTRDKTELTTMSDKMKTYRMGKTDASGSMTGITTIGHDIIKNKFLDILDVAQDRTFTLSKQSNTPVYFIGYINANKDVASGVLSAVVGRVDIESGNLGATAGSAQEFTANFATFSGDKLQLINIQPSV